MSLPASIRFHDAHSFVRYVDPSQAVIDTSFCLHHVAEDLSDKSLPETSRVLFEIDGANGFHDEQFADVVMGQGQGKIRFDLVEPDLWSPAGMGDQTLYQVSLTLLEGLRIIDKTQTTLGLTSVRIGQHTDSNTLLVNGQVFHVHSVVPMDHVNENSILPVSGDSLVVVRDHYGADVLYDAADRAGILMIQCVPIHPYAMPEDDIAEQVSRLSNHPSLAGWHVGSQGKLGSKIALSLKQLDPTHRVFTEMPENWAA